MQALEGSVNDQKGNASEIASIIKKFTEPTHKDGGLSSQEKPNGELVRDLNLSFNVVVLCLVVHNFIYTLPSPKIAAKSIPLPNGFQRLENAVFKFIYYTFVYVYFSLALSSDKSK